MGNKQVQGDLSPRQLINERDPEYGDAWRVAGELYAVMSQQMNLVSMPGWSAYPIISILSKLCRACLSPYNKDHWRDIAGYAELVVRYLDAGNK